MSVDSPAKFVLHSHYLTCSVNISCTQNLVENILFYEDSHSALKRKKLKVQIIYSVSPTTCIETVKTYSSLDFTGITVKGFTLTV